MTGIKRYKPRKEVVQATHEASAADYEKLAAAVVEAIALKKRDIVVRFPYFAKLAEDWPRGILIKRDEQYDYFRVKVFKAADWLHKHGYLSADAKGIVKSMRQVNNLIGVVERTLADPVKMLYTNVSATKEE